MTDTKINHVVQETITLATGNLTQATNAAAGAGGIELYGTGASTPTWQFTPKLMSLQWNDNGVFSDGTGACSDRTSTFAINSFAATDDLLYIGADVPFRAVYVNITNTNGTSSVLSAFYWDGTNWTGLTETDNTASAGATLAVDNTITWTVPSDWAKTSVNGIGQLYFVRFSVSVTLDTTVSLADVIPLSIQTGRAVSPGTAAVLPRYWFDRGGVGGIEAVGDNTDTLVVTWLGTSAFSTLTAE